MSGTRSNLYKRNSERNIHHRIRISKSPFQIHRQIPQYPARNEKHAAYCNKREYHVLCGPEKHCDRSCDNMYTPPNCYHDANNPKCYFPRCLCKDEYVRNAQGHCIRDYLCPNRYSEPNRNTVSVLFEELLYWKTGKPSFIHPPSVYNNYFEYCVSVMYIDSPCSAVLRCTSSISLSISQFSSCRF
ncbi:hypothetical protein DICVIV_03137 [Dictyocaulus viviparus]|uniref:TIL domain-containing protein n=1 Tax=Dictyocaulus viviparus TaxID=29172 RepID=A0A0D8Y3G4_DICVI|nr:hypothetical protein DICVIV_03137 [Dictyocaulus viviparus]